MTIVPNTEDKFCWEGGHCFLELISTAMGAMVCLWDPVKTKTVIKSQE